MKHRRKSHATRGSARRSALGLACLALVMASCQPPERKPEPAAIDRVGLVLLSQGAGAAAGQATFVKLPSARAEELFANPFGAQLGACQVSVGAPALTGAVTSAPSGDRLSAATVELRSSAGAFGKLERGADGRYALTGATEALPESLTLRQAASGVFPAFPSVKVDTGAAPTLAPGFSAMDVTAETRFGWLPGAAGSAVVLVGSSGNVTFSCVADDALGAFRFPAETRAELTEAGFGTGTLDTIARIATTQARSGSALLLVSSLRTTDLGGKQ